MSMPSMVIAPESYFIESGYKVAQRGLSAAGGTNQRNGLALVYAHGKVRYHLGFGIGGVAVGIAEGYVVKNDVAFKLVRVQLALVLLFGFVHYLHEPLEARHALLKLLKQAHKAVYGLHEY